MTWAEADWFCDIDDHSGACTGASEAAHAMHLQHAAAQHWQPLNDGHQHGDTGYTNGHSSWPAQQNGGVNGGSNGVFWHDGQARHMPPPGGWDASNHPLSELFLRGVLLCSLHVWLVIPLYYTICPCQHRYHNTTAFPLGGRDLTEASLCCKACPADAHSEGLAQLPEHVLECCHEAS